MALRMLRVEAVFKQVVWAFVKGLKLRPSSVEVCSFQKAPISPADLAGSGMRDQAAVIYLPGAGSKFCLMLMGFILYQYPPTTLSDTPNAFESRPIKPLMEVLVEPWIFV